MSQGTRSASSVQRTVLCFAVTLVTYWCISGSLFFRWPQAQLALVVGVVAGLVGELWWAGGSAALVMALGTFAGPHSLWDPAGSAPSLASLGWIALAGGVGAGVAWMIAQRMVAPRWVFWGVVAVLVANMWFTAVTIDSARIFDPSAQQSVPSVAAAIGGDLSNPMKDSDEYLYVWLLQRMRGGTDYYSAFAQARPALEPGANGPTSVANFRQPLLYLALAASPNPWVPLVLQLLLVTGAALGVTVLVRDVVKLPVALPGIAAVLAFGLFAVTKVPLYAEAWAGPLCLIALVLISASLGSQRWRGLVIAAAATALLAFFIRELAVFAIVAGLAGAYFSASEQRGFRLKVWGGALGIAVAGYAVHWMLAAPHVVRATGNIAKAEGFALFSGGPAFAAHALIYGLDVPLVALGISWLVPAALALIGIAGASTLPHLETRIMALGTIAGVVLFSLVAGNNAHDVLTGAATNYWGAISAYAMYGCIPVAFGLLAAARVRQPDVEPRRAGKK